MSLARLRVMRRRRLLILPAWLALLLAISPPTVAAGVDFTWRGAPIATGWSAGDNWVGGMSPGGSVGTLLFPPLTSLACGSPDPTNACAHSTNDISGLNVNAITFDAGVGVSGYGLDGNPLSLGAGGIHVNSGFNGLNVPLVLTAPQTWTVGNGSGPTGLTVRDLSGASAPLMVIFPASSGSGGSLQINGRTDVGPVTVQGSGASPSPYDYFALSEGATLNAGDRHAVLLSHVPATLEANTSVGALTTAATHIFLGTQLLGVAPGLVSTASAAFDSESVLNYWIHGEGITPGTDYPQLASNGPVSLGGVLLELDSRACEGVNPPAGQVETLVTTTGTLRGAFGNAGEGTTITRDCVGGQPAYFRINYHETGSPQTVTATVVGSTARLPPASLTGPATDVTAGRATLNGTVNPNGLPTGSVFQYGTDINYGSQVPVAPAFDSDGSGSVPVPVSDAVAGLALNTTYHYRLVTKSSAGTTNGNDQTFMEPDCPGVTVAASGKLPGSLGDKLNKLAEKKYVLAHEIADVGPLAIAGYAEVGVADASLCFTSNVTVADLKPFGPQSSLLSLFTQTPQHSPTTETFGFDALRGWQYRSGSADWSLTPVDHNPFSLDWHDAKLQPVQGLSYDDVKGKTAIKADIAELSSPALVTRLIDGPPLYLSASLQAKATFGVAFSPAQIKLVCAMEASSLPGLLFGTNGVIPFQKAQQFQTAVQKYFPEVLRRFPALYAGSDIVAGVAAVSAGLFVLPACADGVQEVSTGILVIVAAPVVITVGAAAGIAALLGRAAFGQLQTAAAVHRSVALPASGPLEVLKIGQARIRTARGLVAAPLASGEVTPFARALQLLPAAARVRRLVVSTSRLRAGGRIVVLGAGLPGRAPHRATIVMRGPGYSAARVVAERAGVAGGVVQLPAHMRPGSWAIAVIDDSLLRPGPAKSTRGFSEVRLGVFHVGARRKGRHGGAPQTRRKGAAALR